MGFALRPHLAARLDEAMAQSQLADLAARMTLGGFDAFNSEFQAITRRAELRFEERDWTSGRRDASERLDLYEQALDRLALQLSEALGPQSAEVPLWSAARPRFAALARDRYDIDRAETFFNSTTRRMLKTVGINREVEFFFLHPKESPSDAGAAVTRTYTNQGNTARLFQHILDDFHFRVGYERSERDAALVAREVDLFMWPVVGGDMSYRVDIVGALFYRNKEAYIVGRINAGGRPFPLVIPLVNGESGVYADTVLLHQGDVSILFSFAYSSFFVDVERYDALIPFLRSIIPHADTAGLYTALGYNRHGKTEFYRELHRYVHVSKEHFAIAPGKEGAVMIAFTLPNYGSVFKVIKDSPCFLRSPHETPKTLTNEEVRRQYDFVSHRDRAGRMVDTQEFENLRFRTKRFSRALLDEFRQAATRAVTVTDQYVILRHVYVQRKVMPLPLYFQNERDPEAIRHALLDFGYFLKDIASSGVFPCDLFNTWNYGVTTWGRVVLFDYDDVLPIERVTFREKPSPRFEFEETGLEEDWIVASGEDFFMDEIDRYSGIPAPLKGVFNSVHGDLYTLRFWDRLTDQLRRGEVFDVIPYERGRRFHGEVV
jgi:isocitrate dehydrogenase kinase/phosphatase